MHLSYHRQLSGALGFGRRTPRRLPPVGQALVDARVLKQLWVLRGRIETWVKNPVGSGPGVPLLRAAQAAGSLE